MSDHVDALCERAQSGDRAAASELISLFYGGIFAYLRRLAGSDDDAADLTQKTFCQAWNSLSSFDGRSRFNTWLHSIAHHVYVDWRRKTNRLDVRSDDWWNTCSAEGPSPFESAAERDTAEQVYLLVDQLEDEQRAAVHLHYFQGLTLPDTAEALGISLSTVKYRLRAALDALQAAMAEPKIRV